MRNTQATLLYDGDCAICRWWAEYYRQRSGGKTKIIPYQEGLGEFPFLTVEQCRAAIQHIDADGRHHFGAAAAFRTLAEAEPARRFWWALYRRLPGFSAATEAGYRFFSVHRGALSWLTRIAWGRRALVSTHAISVEWFMRLLGAVYCSAFISLLTQAPGLIGERGILPLGERLQLLAENLDWAALKVPTLFWLAGSDAMIAAVCWAGAGLGAWLALAPSALLWQRRAALAAAFALYLSLVHAGQVFTRFQWDLMLLECGFLAIFLDPRRELSLWLYRAFLLRFMLLSGFVKLASGDPSWSNLSALSYHYETQPLPAPLAWHAYHLPTLAHKAGVFATLVIELALPLLLLAPRRPRMFAASCFIVLEIAILLTGNYNFFNLLTIFVCLLMFDDAALSKITPRRWRALLPRVPTAPARLTSLSAAVAASLLALGAAQTAAGLGRPIPVVEHALMPWIQPFGICNRYGLFAVMTTRRLEIEIEGSIDGARWERYEFHHKPEDIYRRPSWNIPHQPRLDWQMWFAALSAAERQPWFSNFLARLLQGAEPVEELLRRNPFTTKPPKYIRASLYHYRFTTPEQRKKSGAWWRRERLGWYFPPASLSAPPLLPATEGNSGAG